MAFPEKLFVNSSMVLCKQASHSYKGRYKWVLEHSLYLIDFRKEDSAHTALICLTRRIHVRLCNILKY